jgi:glycine hydroxymethyltransferase
MNAAEWRKIDKGAFPGSSSNHHLDTLVSLAITTYEMLEFGRAYAKQTIANAKALARALHSRGLAVQAAEFGFTETHQIAVDVREFGGGDETARVLKDNGIILNMNLLPHEPLDKVNNPDGVRLGSQEMTRVGMKEQEMEHVAELITRCLKEGKYVGDEVKEFRARFQKAEYSFDDVARTGEKAPEGTPST